MDRDQELQQKCLTLISRIAARCAMRPDPQRVYDTLMELSNYLRGSLTGSDLERMHSDLITMDSDVRENDPLEMLKFEVRSTWN
jgi:hypothetical protein